jgi:RNA-dependent RNA polymerase
MSKVVRPLTSFGGVLGGPPHSYSQSGLRDRSVWFVAPWSDVDRNGKPFTIEAETIRQQLGLFDKISRMPAKLGARFSQGFTASIATVVS